MFHNHSFIFIVIFIKILLPTVIKLLMNSSLQIKVGLPKIINQPIPNFPPKLQTLLRPSFLIKNTAKNRNEFTSIKRQNTEFYKNESIKYSNEFMEISSGERRNDLDQIVVNNRKENPLMIGEQAILKDSGFQFRSRRLPKIRTMKTSKASKQQNKSKDSERLSVSNHSAMQKMEFTFYPYKEDIRFSNHN